MVQRTICVALLGAAFAAAGCNVRRAEEPARAAAYESAPPAAAAEPATASAPALVPATPSATGSTGDAFTTTVRPILAKRCAPCHEPGGQMYVKLPFDRPGPIREHATAALRRFSDAEEKQVMEAWFATPEK